MKTIQLTKIIGIFFLLLFSSVNSLNEFTKSFKANFLKICLLFVSILVFPIFDFAQENGGPYTTDENTVLLMHFEDNVENSADVGANGILHGSGVSYETSVDGQGKCIRLDNSTSDKQSWIEVPFYDELNFSEEFSIECWFKINSWGEEHTKWPFLLKKGEGWPADYEITLSGEAKRIQANLNCINDEHNRGTDAGTVNNIIQANTWYHLSITYSAPQKHMYLLIRDENFNEYFASRGFVATPPFNSTDKLFIGFGNGGNNFFDGWIDELRISNKYKKYRDDIVSIINTAAFKDSISPLLSDKWKVYFDPIRQYFPVDTITGEIHKGNSCGMTMFTRTVHFWEHPRFPIGKIEYWTDNIHWLADYDNSEYEFDLMPNTFPQNPNEEEYGPSSFFTVQLSTATR